MNKALKRLIRGIIVVAVLVVLRLVLPSFFDGVTGDVIKFMTVFLAILMTFIFFIAVMAAVLDQKIHPSLFNKVLLVLIIGIVLGVIGMFQPWSQDLYRIGFHVLFVSLFSFMFWTHITPKRIEEEEGTGALPLDVSDAVEA
jgi:FtsH-binding integral membrane protein